ncbi:MAG: DUF3095 domain-containing protein [Nannocystaceae bacterium]|nr:DUF3095 domain-containing protein [bacterium]
MKRAGFYAELPTFDRFADVHDASLYVLAPGDWDVVVTDVEGSTTAIEAGRYKDVNALGVASIVALRNALPAFDLPFVFGGDGATVLTPASERDRVHAALRGIRAMAHDAMEMSMRVSMVPVEVLHADGFEVLVARFGASPHASYAMFAGAGLSEAERRIKDPQEGPLHAVGDEGPCEASFEGFECRWEPLESRRGKVVSLLVQATAEDRNEAAQTYRRVLGTLESIVGDSQGRPVGPDNLAIARGGRAFDAEARITSGHGKGVGLFRRKQAIKAQSAFGRFGLSRGKETFGFPADVYRDEVTANTDFRKFDDTLRMVLDVTDAQHESIEAALGELHAQGAIVYGTHVASAALMTCAVTSYRGDHMHFVDGADGGYALAAKQLKRQRAD